MSDDSREGEAIAAVDGFEEHESPVVATLLHFRALAEELSPDDDPFAFRLLLTKAIAR
jgi:hypothetical protein